LRFYAERLISVQSQSCSVPFNSTLRPAHRFGRSQSHDSTDRRSHAFGAWPPGPSLCR
jgi:hypothetical protein